MLEVQEAAEKLVQQGLSVIPIERDTKNCLLEDWSAYQGRQPSMLEIESWFATWPDCELAVVLGKHWNLMVVNIEGADLKKRYVKLCGDHKGPQVRTPHGWHLYVQHRDMSNVFITLSGIKLLSDGQYALVPPSRGFLHGKRWPYKWITEFDADVYPICYKLLQRGAKVLTPKLPSWDKSVARKMSQALRKIGLDNDERFGVMLHIWPNHQKEIDRIIQKGSTFIGLAGAIKEWVATMQGRFTTSDIYRELDIYTRADKQQTSKTLSRLVEDGVLRRLATFGSFEKVTEQATPIELGDRVPEAYPIKLPFGLHEMVKIMSKNIILVAGEANVGKTAFMLDILKRNHKHLPTAYFSSEMGADEFRERAEHWDEKEINWQRLHLYECPVNPADAIQPDSLNIIDYLEIYDEFWLIGRMLNEIYTKLNKGVAVIAIQKDRGSKVGRGRSFSLEKPRLYVSLSRMNGRHRAKIVKAKNYYPPNPNGKELIFQVVNGVKLVKATAWK